MNYDIPESVSQGSNGAYDEENRRIHEIADELRRRSQLYETQLRNSQDDINHLDIEQRVAEQYAKENGIWIAMSDTSPMTPIQPVWSRKTTRMEPPSKSLGSFDFSLHFQFPRANS